MQLFAATMFAAFPKRSLLAVSSLIATTIGGLTLGSAQPDKATVDKGDVTNSFSAVSVWDDGLSEMSYFDATDLLYGKPRKYTRVVLVNRQWMDPASGTKADPVSDHAVPVFKLNISEELPTENYNYRYLNTLFLILQRRLVMAYPVGTRATLRS